MNTSVPASRTLGTRFVQKPSGLPFGVDKSAWTPVMHKEACADVWTRFFWRDVVCACFVFIACACFVFPRAQEEAGHQAWDHEASDVDEAC